MKAGDDPTVKPQQGQVAQVIYAGRLKSNGQEVDKGMAAFNVMEGDCIQGGNLHQMYIQSQIIQTCFFLNWVF